MKLVYVSFYVEDVDKAADWLVKFYKGEKSPVCNDDGCEKCMVTFSNGAGIQLIRNPAITEKTVQRHPGLGYHHIAINVGSDARYEQLIKDLSDSGYSFLTGPRINSFGTKEGIVIGEGGNLTIQTAPSRGSRAGDGDPSVLNHVGFFVSDNKEFAKFFVRYLNASDDGCSPVNPKTGQDNYMVGFENGVSVELMTCPDMIPEPEDRYKKLGFRSLAIVCKNAAEFDEKTKALLQDGFDFLVRPAGGQAVVLAPGNIAVQLISPDA